MSVRRSVRSGSVRRGSARRGSGKKGGVKQFVALWDTEEAGSPTKTIVLPMTAGPLVDWGDGTVDNLNTHVYAVGGADKLITIDDTNVDFRFNNGGDKLKILQVFKCSGLNINNNGTFSGCENMTWTATDAPTINTLTLQNTMNNCRVFNGNLDSWSTGGVENFNGFAANNKELDHYHKFDVSSADNLSSMYLESPKIENDGSVSYTLKPAASVNCSAMFRANQLITTPMVFVNDDSITNHSGMYSFTDITSLPAYDYTNSTNVTGYMQQACGTGALVLNAPLATSLNDSFSNNDFSSITINMSSSLSSLSFSFAGNTNLATVNLFPTQNVTTARFAFNNCVALTSLPAFDFSSCTNFDGFLSNVTINTTDYDALLIRLDGYGQTNVLFDGGNSKYTSGGAAETARNNLLAKGWTINDGGPV